MGARRSDYYYPRDAPCVPVIFFEVPLRFPMSDTVSTLNHRVKVFIDFWNFSLSMQNVDQDFRADWSQLGPVLSGEAVKVINDSAVGEYQGLNLYGSYDPTSEKDRKMRGWATSVVGTFAGVSVSMVPRQRKRSPPKCPVCYREVAVCPRCSADMRGTEEKGVDVRIATDMISLAWVNNYNVAVLVSSDRDFIPLVEFLETRGIKVIHGSFPPEGAQLTRKLAGGVSIWSICGRNFRLVRKK